ncbi:MAG: hypothetical protein FJZ67_11085 [Bacteroidetes bacterium]|nr:hypothetical protein [Bacteroidota bacterium]
MKRITFSLYLALLFLGFSNTVIACDCKPSSSIEKSFENSRLVIHGKVLSKEFITYSETLLPNWSDTLTKWAKDKGQLLDLAAITPNVIRVKVLVLNAYKNQSHLDTLTIFTPRSSANCGFNEFEVGNEFVIFNGEDLFKPTVFKTYGSTNIQLFNTFWTNQCTRTSKANQEELVDSLNIITAPIRAINPKVKQCEFYIDSLTYERIYTNADSLPQFKSGQFDLMDFYKATVSFPPIENEITDTSFNTQVAFIINPNGRISQIRFVKSEVKSYEKELIQFIKEMPPWNPGKCGKNFVSYELTLNFRFESKRKD